MNQPMEAEFFLQWGSRKRLRCVRVRGNNPAEVSSSSNASSSAGIRRRITSRFFTLSHKDASSSQPTSRRHTRNSEMAMLRSEVRRSSSFSPEKEERYYTTRGSITVGLEENGKIIVDEGAGKQGGDLENHHRYENSNGMSGSRKLAWPKLCIALSSKEKEEDFMAMKGCKLPQRPRKRAKVIQRTLLLASPGAWLTDMSLERYEVREKKICNKKQQQQQQQKQKKARGLKGITGSSSSSMDTDYSE